MSAPAGWYPDPERPGAQRRWNGDTWTDDRQPAPPARVPLSQRRMRPAAIVWSAAGLGVLLVLTVLLVGVNIAQSKGDPVTADVYTPEEYAYLSAARDALPKWSADVETDMLAMGRDVCGLFAQFPDLPRAELIEPRDWPQSRYEQLTDELQRTLWYAASDNLCPQ